MADRHPTADPFADSPDDACCGCVSANALDCRWFWLVQHPPRPGSWDGNPDRPCDCACHGPTPDQRLEPHVDDQEDP